MRALFKKDRFGRVIPEPAAEERKTLVDSRYMRVFVIRVMQQRTIYIMNFA